MPIFFYLLGLYWINFAGGVDVVGKFKKRGEGGGWGEGGTVNIMKEGWHYNTFIENCRWLQ